MNRPQLGVSESLGRRHSDGSVPQSNNMVFSMSVLEKKVMNSQIAHSQSLPPEQAQDLDFPHPHFALIYLDHNGKLQVEASPSIAGCGGAIFTPDVTDRFMEMAIPNPQPNMPFHPSESHTRDFRDMY